MAVGTKKTGVSIAIGFLAGLASGVGSASVVVEALAHSAPAPHVQPQHLRKSEPRQALRRAATKAKRLAQLLEVDIERLDSMPAGVDANAASYSALADALRYVERDVRQMLSELGKDTASDIGLLELRHNLAAARSKAVIAQRLAFQKTATPATHEGKTSGEALAAVADRMTAAMS
jgi:C4-dicarboxylate-specific signal transduction histidine kinase|tara:strand:+ start:573 stop:1100 length:528 start_codon:yes stop_codon:yes gene_type:complete